MHLCTRSASASWHPLRRSGYDAPRRAIDAIPRDPSRCIGVQCKVRSAVPHGHVKSKQSKIKKTCKTLKCPACPVH
eukprot:scaffold3631_cov124-Isochrysis_galbana.AAC.4